MGKNVLASHQVGNQSYLSHHHYYIIQQPVQAGSKRYAISTDRDAEDHYLYIIHLAVFQLSANDTRSLISYDLSLLVTHFSIIIIYLVKLLLNFIVLSH